MYNSLSTHFLLFILFKLMYTLNINYEVSLGIEYSIRPKKLKRQIKTIFVTKIIKTTSPDPP